MKRWCLAVVLMAAILASLSSSHPVAAGSSTNEVSTGHELVWPCESRFIAMQSSQPEEGVPLSEVLWPCESRFALPRSVAALPAKPDTTLDWPCELRFIVMKSSHAEEGVPMSEVLWPCESRFAGSLRVAALPAKPDTTLDWPCESRFIAMKSSHPEEGVLLSDVLWPCESRFASVPAVVGPPAPLESPVAALEANKELYRRALLTFFESGDPDTLFAYYPEQLAMERADEWTAIKDAFTDLSITLDFQVAEGDRVINCWTFQGTHSGGYMGLPPSGNHVMFTGLFAGHIQDGKIVDEMIVIDRHELMQQILAPQPRGT